MTAAIGQNTPFSSLLTTIGEKLETQQVRLMKYLLKGHINGETLQYLTTGQQLTKALNERGLVTERKLAFLRKLLVEAKSLKLVDMLDNYKLHISPNDKTAADDEKSGRASKLTGKREILLRMIDRIENEIQLCEEEQEEFESQLKQCEIQIKLDSEKLVVLEDSIQKSKEEIKENKSQIECYERKLETLRFFLRKQAVEIDKLKRAREKDETNMNLKHDLKEKEDEREKNKKREDEILAKHQEALDRIRTSHVEIRHHVTDSIRLEDVIHDYLMQIRAAKQGIRKGKRTLMELQEKLEELTFQLEKTKRLKPLTPTSRPKGLASMSAMETHTDGAKEPVDIKLLDYGELSESEAIVIGRKGKRLSPPQFNTPCSVAADKFGNIYVVDYGNSRVQVIDVDGRAVRQPLNVGGKFKPCAITVSCDGDIALTDSQIIRVFRRNGQPLRPVLPVFGKNDRSPNLSALAFDLQRNIYIADKANHKVEKFTFDGNFICFIGDAQCLYQPVGVVVTRAGDIVVSEHSKHRLRVFLKENMTECKTIGSKGVGNCKFMCPRGLALDKQDNILVADSENHRIQIVSVTGECIGVFGKIGSEPGFLDTPHDLAVDAEGNVVVADTKNHRIQVFTRKVPIYVENVICNRDEVTSIDETTQFSNEVKRTHEDKVPNEEKKNEAPTTKIKDEQAREGNGFEHDHEIEIKTQEERRGIATVA